MLVLMQEGLAEAINQYLKRHFPDLYHPSLLMTQSYVSDLELGKTDPSLPILQAMSGFFGVDIDELLVSALRSFPNKEVNLSEDS